MRQRSVFAHSMPVNESTCCLCLGMERTATDATKAFAAPGHHDEWGFFSFQRLASTQAKQKSSLDCSLHGVTPRWRQRSPSHRSSCRLSVVGLKLIPTSAFVVWQRCVLFTSHEGLSSGHILLGTVRGHGTRHERRRLCCWPPAVHPTGASVVLVRCSPGEFFVSRCTLMA